MSDISKNELIRKYNSLSTNLIQAIANLGTTSILNGSRKMYHFFLNKASLFSSVGPSLVEHFNSEDLKVQFGSVYVYSNGEWNFLVYKDDSVWEEYTRHWLGWNNRIITSEECCKYHGRLFGYSEEAIDRYLEIGSLFPNDDTSGTIVAVSDFLTYDPSKKPVPTFTITR